MGGSWHQLYVGAGGRPGAPRDSGGREAGPQYVACPVCKRLTPVDGGYCVHCGSPLTSSGSIVSSRVPPGYRWDIGVGVDWEGNPAGLRLRDLGSHVVVFGSVGRGKTTFAKRVVYEAAVRDPGLPFVVVDWEGEYAGIGRLVGGDVLVVGREPGPGEERLSLDLFQPLGRGSAGVRAAALWAESLLVQSMLDEGFEVTPQMQAVIRRACFRAVEESVDASGFLRLLWEEARGLPSGDRTAAAVEARLHRLLGSGVVERGPPGGGPVYVGRRVVVDLSPLSSINGVDARFVARLVVMSVYREVVLRGLRGRPGMLLVIDEAEQVAPARREPGLLGLASVMMHARKRGLGVIAVAHSPSMLEAQVAKLASTVVVFSLTDYQDLRLAAGAVGSGDEATIRLIMGLQEGEAIIRAAGSPRPFLVRVADVDPAVSEKAMRLLEDVYRHPYRSTRERRSLLGVNGRDYARLVEELKMRGLVREVYVYKGVGRPVKLLQPRGLNPGAAHEYGVREVKSIAGGLECVEEVRAPGSWGADVEVVGRNGVRVAIEVETGSNIVAGKYVRLLGKGYDYIIVVCTFRGCSRAVRPIAVAVDPQRVKCSSIAFVAHLLQSLLGCQGR